MDGTINNHPEWGNRPINTNTASSALSLVWMLGTFRCVCLNQRTHTCQETSKQPWERTSRKRGQNTGSVKREKECGNRRVNVVREEGQSGEGTGNTCENATETYYCRISICRYVCMYIVHVCEICIFYKRFRGSYPKTGNIIPPRHHRLSNKKCTSRMGSLSLSCQWSPTDCP